jgi:hypothetical protein
VGEWEGGWVGRREGERGGASDKAGRGACQGMYLVVHDKCKYPISTDASVMGPRSDFPGPLLGDVEYVTYPDPRIDVYSF